MNPRLQELIDRIERNGGARSTFYLSINELLDLTEEIIGKTSLEDALKLLVEIMETVGFTYVEPEGDLLVLSYKKKRLG